MLVQDNRSIVTDSTLNKQMGINQAVFTPTEGVQEAAQVFFSFQRQNKETQTQETIVHSTEGDTWRCSRPQGWFFSLRLHSQGLGGRKDIRAFFPELTEEYWEVG